MTKETIPAYPMQFADDSFQSGMTLRDYFAAMAMQAYCSRKDFTTDTSQDDVALIAYDMADSMLEARK